MLIDHIEDFQQVGFPSEQGSYSLYWSFTCYHDCFSVKGSCSINLRSGSLLVSHGTCCGAGKILDVHVREHMNKV